MKNLLIILLLFISISCTTETIEKSIVVETNIPDSLNGKVIYFNSSNSAYLGNDSIEFIDNKMLHNFWLRYDDNQDSIFICDYTYTEWSSTSIKITNFIIGNYISYFKYSNCIIPNISGKFYYYKYSNSINLTFINDNSGIYDGTYQIYMGSNIYPFCKYYPSEITLRDEYEYEGTFSIK